MVGRLGRFQNLGEVSEAPTGFQIFGEESEALTGRSVGRFVSVGSVVRRLVGFCRIVGRRRIVGSSCRFVGRAARVVGSRLALAREAFRRRQHFYFEAGSAQTGLGFAVLWPVGRRLYTELAFPFVSRYAWAAQCYCFWLFYVCLTHTPGLFHDRGSSVCAGRWLRAAFYNANSNSPSRGYLTLGCEVSGSVGCRVLLRPLLATVFH